MHPRVIYTGLNGGGGAVIYNDRNFPWYLPKGWRAHVLAIYHHAIQKIHFGRSVYRN